MNINPTILIVDDDDFVRNLYVQKFKGAGFTVLEGKNGEEAYAAMGKSSVDIVFTGIIMPVMNGFELMEHLAKHESYKSIPVLISSHRGKAEDRVKAFSLGARDFIVSSFVSPNEVVERVKEILKKPKAYVLTVDPAGAGFEELKKNYQQNFLEGKVPTVHLIPKDDGKGFDAELK